MRDNQLNKKVTTKKGNIFVEPKENVMKFVFGTVRQERLSEIEEGEKKRRIKTGGEKETGKRENIMSSRERRRIGRREKTVKGNDTER